MNIKGFKIKNQKIQKLWIIILFSFSIAIFLISLSFYAIFKINKTNVNTNDLFNFSSYYAKYSIVTYTNKNQNTYIMEEYCQRKDDEIKFRFNTMNKDSNFSYIITNNTFAIKSDDQINKFDITNYVKNEDNILSLYSFLDIYNKINELEKLGNLSENEGIKFLMEEKDENVIYTIEFQNIKVKQSNSKFQEYKDAFVNGMKISKLELIFDKQNSIPQEYIIYSDDDKAYVDIVYSEFKINLKIEEKVFSF